MGAGPGTGPFLFAPVPWKRITDLEAALGAAGIPYRRWCDWSDGWFFEVRDEVVARVQAIGLLEQDVRRWLR